MNTPNQAAFQDLMTKIERLQNLAERAGTPHEAEVAAAKMQRLLLKHNLSSLDLETFRAERGEGLAVSTTWVADKSPWKAKLAGAVAGAHMCVAVRQQRDTNDWVFLLWGRPENLAVAWSVYQWLVELIPTLTNQAHAKAAGDVWYQEDAWFAQTKPRQWKHSFRLGFIDGLIAAYKQQREAEEYLQHYHDANRNETPQPTPWAIVPLLEAEAADAMKREIGEPERNELVYGQMDDKMAYARGFHRGRDINVGTTQLEAET